jgi:hypothetical protein
MPRSAKSPRRRGFGSIRRLPSGRYQAGYVGPDTIRRTAPTTFETREDAEAWLTDRRREITAAGDDWTPPPARKRPTPLTFAEYADGWLAARDLRPRTKALYESLLRVHLVPTFGDQPLSAITAIDVKRWHAAVNTGPTARANAYGLLRTIMADAVDEEVIARSPVRIKGAGSKRRARELRVLTPGELAAIADAAADSEALMCRIEDDGMVDPRTMAGHQRRVGPSQGAEAALHRPRVEPLGLDNG